MSCALHVTNFMLFECYGNELNQVQLSWKDIVEETCTFIHVLQVIRDNLPQVLILNCLFIRF